MERRVVVTGMGAITPIGNNVETFWNNVKAGVLGIDEITKFDTTDYSAKLAAEVKDFNAKEVLGFKQAKRLYLFSICSSCCKRSFCSVRHRYGKGRSIQSRCKCGLGNWRPGRYGRGTCQAS